MCVGTCVGVDAQVCGGTCVGVGAHVCGHVCRSGCSSVWARV